MAIELFDPDLITARLAAQVPALKKIGQSADIPSSQADLKNVLPAAYVFQLRDTPRPNNVATTVVSQQDIVRFAVLFAVENVRDMRGQAAQAALKPLRQATIGALLGWPPGAAYDVIQYGGGRLVIYDPPVLWWQDEFITGLYLRSG